VETRLYRGLRPGPTLSSTASVNEGVDPLQAPPTIRTGLSGSARSRSQAAVVSPTEEIV
jgi:hypothetical protein